MFVLEVKVQYTIIVFTYQPHGQLYIGNGRQVIKYYFGSIVCYSQIYNGFIEKHNNHAVCEGYVCAPESSIITPHTCTRGKVIRFVVIMST